VQRQFNATELNALWISDITYLPTWQGFLFVETGTRAVRWSAAAIAQQPIKIQMDGREVALTRARVSAASPTTRGLNFTA
jgi:transposase InsO family protein